MVDVNLIAEGIILIEVFDFRQRQEQQRNDADIVYHI